MDLVLTCGTPFPSVLKQLESVARLESVASLADVDAALLADAAGLMLVRQDRLDAQLVERMPRLRIVASSNVGYDNVDVAALARRGIPFTNARGALDETVADTTWCLALSAMRRFPDAAAWVRGGAWMKGPFPLTSDVQDKTLGIVGLGAIGVAVARRAQASRMNLIYYNRTRRDDETALGVRYAAFDDLLERADCVVVLVPLSPATRHLFGAAQFARMKPGATFVNVARGAVADTGALLAALQSGTPAYAALDVTDPEPLPPDHPLLGLPNVLVVPHIGSATKETRERMALLAAKNVAAALRGEPLLTPVG